MKFKNVPAVIFCLCVLCACHKPGKGTPDLTIQYDTIPGIDNDLLSLDIYLPDIPASNPTPVVIWVHGGAWAIGDKLNQMEYKQTLFNDLGYLLVSVNYRLSSTTYNPNDANAIRYPVHNQDIAKSIAWVYNNIGDYGGDSSRIVLMGHSAGAHLAALTGTNESFLQAEGLGLSVIKGVASFDTECYDVYRTLTEDPGDLYLNAFGDNPNIWKDASPVYNVGPGKNIPTRFLFTERGEAIRREILHAFADSLTGIGVQTTIIDAGTLSHNGVNEHIGMKGDEVITPVLIGFLADCFQ